MAQGTIYGTKDEDLGLQVRIDWVQSPDKSTNTSTFKFTAYIIADSNFYLENSTVEANFSSSEYYANTGSYATKGYKKMWETGTAPGVSKTMSGGYIPAGTTLIGTVTSPALSHDTDGSLDNYYYQHANGNNQGGPYIRPYVQILFYPDGSSYSDSVSGGKNIGSDCELILYPTEATASTAYISENMTITLNKRSSDYTTTIEYNFGNLSGLIATKTSATSYSWRVPATFMSEFGSNETSKKGSLTITTYKGDSIIGTTVCDFTVLLNANIAGPTFSPTVVDTNSTTIALTGNSNIIVRYYSNAKITTGAAGVNGATISSQKTVCGNQSFTGSSGTIIGVELQEYTITATDSRGLSSKYNGTFSPFVDYSKLSCNLFPSFVGTDGKLTFSIEGNCFKGSFGSVSNTLTVQYRYRTKNGSFGSWTTVSPTHTTSHNYYVDVNLSGLDYRTTYIFQARATDKLATITTPEIIMTSSPIFDWSETDFQFNVEVGANYDFIYSNSAEIMGTDTSGNTRQALAPCDSANNTVLGYGGYRNEVGATKIYGNSIDIISNGDVTVNGSSFTIIQKLINAVTNSYSFTPTVTKGSNYSSASCALTLRGNCLYCRVYGSRSTQTNSGDIPDELIGKVTFEHGGKITGMDYVGAVSSQTGTVASIAIKNPSVTSTSATFDAYLTNTATPGTNFMATFVIPVSLNLNNF